MKKHYTVSFKSLSGFPCIGRVEGDKDSTEGSVIRDLQAAGYSKVRVSLTSKLRLVDSKACRKEAEALALECIDDWAPFMRDFAGKGTTLVWHVHYYANPSTPEDNVYRWARSTAHDALAGLRDEYAMRISFKG